MRLVVSFGRTSLDALILLAEKEPSMDSSYRGQTCVARLRLSSRLGANTGGTDLGLLLLHCTPVTSCR